MIGCVWSYQEKITIVGKMKNQERDEDILSSYQMAVWSIRLKLATRGEDVNSIFFWQWNERIWFTTHMMLTEIHLCAIFVFIWWNVPLKILWIFILKSTFPLGETCVPGLDKSYMYLWFPLKINSAWGKGFGGIPFELSMSKSNHRSIFQLPTFFTWNLIYVSYVTFYNWVCRVISRT